MYSEEGLARAVKEFLSQNRPLAKHCASPEGNWLLSPATLSRGQEWSWAAWHLGNSDLEVRGRQLGPWSVPLAVGGLGDAFLRLQGALCGAGSQDPGFVTQAEGRCLAH